MNYDEEAALDVAAALAPVDGKDAYGQAVVIHRTGAPVKDPNTLVVSVPETNVDGCGIERAYKAYEIDGKNVLAGDIRFMLSPKDATGLDVVPPKAGDKMTIAGGKLRVITCEQKRPAGLLIVSIVQLRA